MGIRRYIRCKSINRNTKYISLNEIRENRSDEEQAKLSGLRSGASREPWVINALKFTPGSLAFSLSRSYSRQSRVLQSNAAFDSLLFKELSRDLDKF